MFLSEPIQTTCFFRSQIDESEDRIQPRGATEEIPKVSLS